MKRIIAALLLILMLCTATACFWESVPVQQTAEPAATADTKDEVTTQAPEEVALPEARLFSLIYAEEASEEIRDYVSDLRVRIKMELLKVDLAVNPATPTAHQIVIGAGNEQAAQVRASLEPNTYAIRGVKAGDAWNLLVVGNNQRSTLAALKRFEALLREKTWEEMLGLELTESLELTYPKSVSIYGDSISTYPGVSNSGLYNSTMVDNKVWYSSNHLSKSQTWWSLVLKALDAKLCVDNAYSGDYTYSDVALNRAKNLHRDAMGKIENPDTIIVYFGINDCWKRVGTPAPKDFESCYGDLIRAMKEAYPEAQIFCCTLLPGYEYKEARLAPLNRGIRAAVKAEGVNLIDLDQLIGAEFLERMAELTVDAENLHPNAEGMKMMGNAISAAIEKWYYGE